MNNLSRQFPAIWALAALLCLPMATTAQQCSQQEVDYLAANASLVQDLSQDCAFDCALAANQDQCLIGCLSQQLALSDTCLQCNATQIQCVLANCALACLFPNSEACQNCIESNCLPPYFVCIGDEDQDGYTEAGGDCNNQDASVYPGAPDEEGDGVDQNCDGSDGTVGIGKNTASQPFRLQTRGGVLCIEKELPFALYLYSGMDGSLLLSLEAHQDRDCLLLSSGRLLFWAMETERGWKRGKVMLGE